MIKVLLVLATVFLSGVANADDASDKVHAEYNARKETEVRLMTAAVQQMVAEGKRREAEEAARHAERTRRKYEARCMMAGYEHHVSDLDGYVRACMIETGY